MTPTNSIKALAVFVFLAGGVASALLTFLLAFFFTLDYPSAHARRESTLLLFIPLLLVFLCPAPLFWGTVFHCSRIASDWASGSRLRAVSYWRFTWSWATQPTPSKISLHLGCGCFRSWCSR